MEYEACPEGPKGRKTEMIVAPGGRPWTMRRKKYTVSIMSERERPIVTIHADAVMVRSACA